MKKIWLDDALIDQYEIMFPLIKKYNIKRTPIIIAVITGSVGKTMRWYQCWRTEYVEISCMTIEQLKEMIDYGCIIASHTVTHRALKYLSDAELIYELEQSKKWIIENLGIIPEIFVPPYGENYVRPDQIQIIEKYYPKMRKQYDFTGGDKLYHLMQDDKNYTLTAVNGEHYFTIIKNNFENFLIELTQTQEKWVLKKITKAVFKNLPNINLPNGYHIRQGKQTINGLHANEGILCEEDIQAWKNLQKNKFNKVDLNITQSKFKMWERVWLVQQYLRTPIKAEQVFFIEHLSKVVGCICVVITKLGIEFHHAMIDPIHRRKGLYKTLIIKCMEYAINKGYKYTCTAPNNELLSFWKRIATLETEEFIEGQ